MAISTPVVGQPVSVELWGKPITDETNRITPIANGVNIVGYANFVAATIPSGYTQANLTMNATGSIAKGITFATTGWTILTAGCYLIFGQYLLSGTAGAGADHSVNTYRGGSTLIGSATLINPAANSWIAGTSMAVVNLNVGDVVSYKGASGTGISLDNRSVVGIKWVAQ